jgi:phosphate transport system protein
VTVLEEKLTTLKQQLLSMAAIVEDMLSTSVQSLVNRDASLAERVPGEPEDRVNRLEIENEDAAINLMALYQPEASNLRTIAMIIKINHDLERLGDHAVNIAEAAQYLIPRPAVKPFVDLPQMAEQALAMLKDSLTAFDRGDAELARDVCGRDSIVDALRTRINDDLVGYMARDSTTIERALKVILISLNLERIADLATNISEDVIYMVKGEVIKHGHGEAQPAGPSTEPVT